MACQLCTADLFREKLGRCKRCFWINVALLLISGAGWLLLFQTDSRHVATIALLMTFIASFVLLILHIIAFIYYRLVNKQNLK